MNRIDLFAGGHPLIIEDVLLIQEAYREAFEGITSGFMDIDTYPNHAIVLYGCQVSNLVGGVRNVTQGFVVLNGEVFNVPAHSFNSNAFWRKNDARFELIETTVGLQPVTYSNASTHQTRFKRELRMFDISVGSSSSVTSSGVFYGLKAALATLKNEWNYVASNPTSYSAGSGTSLQGGTDLVEIASNPWRFKADASGLVLVQGHVQVNNIAVGATPATYKLFKLPTNLFPSQQIAKPSNLGIITVETNGDVNIWTNQNGIFHLDGLVFTND